jgi:capsular polysaccharide biosynthesis protein
MNNKVNSVESEAGQYERDIDQEIDLLEYVSRVLRVKYRLVALAVAMAVVTFSATFLMPNKYVASTLVAFNKYDKPGGVAPKEYRGNDTVSLLERDMVIDTSPENEKDRLIARIHSFDFLKVFVEKHDLMKVIFRNQWDAQKNEWKTGEGVDIRRAIIVFNAEMLGTDLDMKSDMLSIYITTPNPDLSASLANAFVAEFKLYQRQLVLDELSQRRSYLEKRLQETVNMESQRSIFRMLETQLSVETLINVRMNYPLEVIEPALAPLVKSSPKRLLFSVIAFVATMFIGVTYVIGKALFEKIAKGLAKYSVTPAAWDDEKGALTKKGELKNLKKSDKTQPSPPQTGGDSGGAWSDNDG